MASRATPPIPTVQKTRRPHQRATTGTATTSTTTLVLDSNFAMIPHPSGRQSPIKRFASPPRPDRIHPRSRSHAQTTTLPARPRRPSSSSTSSSSLFVPAATALPKVAKTPRRPTSTRGVAHTTLDAFSLLLHNYPWGICISKYVVELGQFQDPRLPPPESKQNKGPTGAESNISTTSMSVATSAGGLEASEASSLLWNEKNNNYGFENFEKLAMAFPEIFCTIQSPLGETLIFPANKRQRILSLEMDVEDATPLFKYFWGEIKTLVVDHGGVLELCKISGLLSQLIGETVEPTNWVLSRQLKYYFYYWCYKKLEDPEVVFVEWSLPLIRPSQSQDKGQDKGPSPGQEVKGPGRRRLRDRERADKCRYPYAGQTQEGQAQVLVIVDPNVPLTLEYKMGRDERHKKEREAKEMELQIAKRKLKVRSEVEKFDPANFMKMM